MANINGTGRTHTPRAAGTVRAAGFAILVALGISACGGDNDQASSSVAAPAAEELDAAASDEGGLAIDVGERAPAASSDAPATGGTRESAAPIDDFGRDLIVEASVTMLTPNVRDAVDDVVRITRDNGGAVFNADVTVDDPLDDQSIPGRGTIVIRIPPAQLDGLIDDLRGVGTLRNQTQSVDDVTDRLIDLDIQIEQAFESVERMQEILGQTTDFESLVAAETELVRRQTAYERLLAAERTIDDRVALSTLTVQIEYRAPAGEEQPTEVHGDKGLGDAFSDGWTAFVGVLFGLAFVLAVTAPFLAVGVVFVLIAAVATRRIRRRQHIARNRHEPLGEPSSTPRDGAGTGAATTGPATTSPVSGQPGADAVGASPTE